MTVGHRIFRYREITEELCQTPDPEIIDLTGEDDSTAPNTSIQIQSAPRRTSTSAARRMFSQT